MMIDYDHQTFEEMLDALDTNIRRLKAEIKMEESAFEELPPGEVAGK